MEKTPGMLDPGVGVLEPAASCGAGLTSGLTGEPSGMIAGDAGAAAAAAFKQNVFIVRHGERRDDVDKEWLANAERPWDPPLTAVGKKQAWAVGKRLRLEGFEVNRVLVSPFIRCVQTAAELIMALCVSQEDLMNDDSTGVSIDFSKVKVSIEFGLAEVMNKSAIRNPRKSTNVPWTLDMSELESMLPRGTLDLTMRSMLPQLPEWGELTEASHIRFVQTIRAAADKFPAEHILCVTHGEAVATSVLHLKNPVMVYGVEYCACSQWQRAVHESNGKLTVSEFELTTEPMKSGVLFGDPSEITASSSPPVRDALFNIL